MTEEVELDRFEAYIHARGVEQPFTSIQYNTYGLYAFDRMRRFRKHILSEDKGLGKTSQVWGVPRFLRKYPQVICTTKRGMKTYEKEAAKWFPELVPFLQLVKGSRAQREKQWLNPNAAIFVTTYHGLLSDAGRRDKKSTTYGKGILPKWVWDCRCWLFDEFHRVIRTPKSAIFDLLVDITAAASKDPEALILPFSGSAVSKGPQDLWPALHLVDRKWWSSYWKYVYMFCIVDDTGFGRTILGPRNVEAWRAAVAPYVTSIRKREVAKHIKEKIRLPLDFEIESWQRKLYEDLLNDQLHELEDGRFILAKSSLSGLYKARLALICPKALDESLGYGAGIETIVEDMEESEINRWVLYTPFKKPIPYLCDYLQAQGYATYVLQGGVSINQQEERIASWAASPKAVMVCTVKYAESFELAPHASYGVFLDHEYDPEENEQAEDRLNRLTSVDPTTIYYAQAENTYHQDLWEHVMQKRYNVNYLLGTPTALKKFLTEGAKALDALEEQGPGTELVFDLTQGFEDDAD